ncbi:hypothetical protein [Neobacillus soli]|uniref:hypothetical protein n=1 Tax=Neobacillus soli TaxID=220688 RepID=UPI000824CFFE|nr:hypothetical protein [Neobacillus soli]
MVKIIYSSQPTKKSSFLSKFIPNRKERKIIILSFLVSAILILSGILLIIANHQQLFTQDFRHYKGTFKQLGSISRIGYFVVISIYPIYFLLKLKKVKNFQWGNFQLKGLLQLLAKLVRKWHVPAALLSTGLIVLHSILAILRGFKVDFTYLTGIASMVVLIFLMFLGLKRFKRTDKQWHFKLAIAFFILFMIHATFS